VGTNPPPSPSSHARGTFGSLAVGITLPYYSSSHLSAMFCSHTSAASNDSLYATYFVGAGVRLYILTPCSTSRQGDAPHNAFYESNRLLLLVTSKMPLLIKSRPATSTKGVIPPVSGSSPLFVLEPEEAEALS
jgi:hypothetical protein